MIKALRTELEKLKTRVLRLCADVEENLNLAEKALIHMDLPLAEKIIVNDEEIDRVEITVEEKCMQILAQHHPVAGDLRFVVTALKINNDLERIGDLTVKIADRIRLLNQTGQSEGPAIRYPEQFRHMFRETIRMVKMSLDSFVNEEPDLAYKVCIWDDEVDDAKIAIRQQIEDTVLKEPGQQRYLGMLLSVSRSLERIADHAVHIAENVIYMLQGHIVRHVFDDLE